MLEDVNGVIDREGKKDRRSKKMLKFLTITFYPTVVLGLIVVVAVELHRSFIYKYNLGSILPVFFIGVGTIVFVVCMGWASISYVYAKCEFTKDGLIVNYPFGASQYCSWDEFQQVCICYADYTTRGPRKAKSVICFVKKGEKKNIYGRWKTDNLFRYKSVIQVDYTEELYKEVSGKYPYDIPDLRKTRAYRL